MLVCLTLKRNVSISAPFLKETHNPLQQIYYVEQDISKLFHLSGMDSFVVEHYIVDVTLCTSDKQNTEEIDGQESIKWDDVILNNFHI